jgi:glycosyltransferase involved in cell wall biosynthesis
MPETGRDADGRSPLVTMIMPVWRPRRDWLLQAVGSALGQRECELELIVVDDGNPQPIAELLAETDDDRVRILRVPHGGEPAARNAGLAEARGDRIRFIDADDALERDSTARLLRLIGTDDDVIAYGATLVCDQDLRPVWKMASRLEGDVVVDCLLGRFTVRPPAMLFTRRVVEATGEWDPAFRVSHDWDYVLRALEHARVRGEREVAAYYRKHPQSSIGRNAATAGEEGARRVIARYFERHPEQRGTLLERQAESRLYAIAARVQASRGQPIECLRRLRQAVALNPAAVMQEITQSLPAVGGQVRHVLSRPVSTEWTRTHPSL